VALEHPRHCRADTTLTYSANSVAAQVERSHRLLGTKRRSTARAPAADQALGARDGIVTQPSRGLAIVRAHMPGSRAGDTADERAPRQPDLPITRK
jgi:hypothetical protein